MNQPDFSIVIPVYNEETNLQQLLQRTLDACRSLQRSFELILIDDGSSDTSAQLIAAAAEREKEVIAVLLNRNYGQHAAVFSGLCQSCGAVVITLDADLQNPPEEIPNLLRETDAGADVVGTVRQQRQDSWFRKLASSLVNQMVRQATGVMMKDYGCMLRAYKRPIVEAMLQCPERSTFIPILANSFARTTAEIPVKHDERQSGESKYSLWKLVSLQFDLLTSMSTFPLRLLSFLGVAIALFGISFGTLLVILRVIYGAVWAGNGVFSLFAILFVFVGAQFIGLGLLGEYIGRIYHDVRGRPRYFVQQVIGASLPGEPQEKIK